MKLQISTPPRSAAALFCLLALTSLSAGCIKYAKYGGVPTMAQTSPDPATLHPYLLQVGDQLTIKFYRNEELDQEVVVRPDGKISLPFIDDVLCAGRSPSEVDQDISRRYVGELAVPDVTVIVNEFGGQRVYVSGEVGGPAVVELAGGMTVMQAIAEAGGFETTAHLKQVILIRRDESGQPVGHSIDMRPVMYGTAPNEDVALQPYDIVFVPRSKIANVNLFMQQYIRDALPVDPAAVAWAFIYK